MSLLHFAARNEIKRDKLEVARKLYAKAFKTSSLQYARTFLLCALLEQRSGNIEKARSIFRIGSHLHPQDDALQCAFGLMESKHGHPSDAQHHLITAVTLNPKRHQALLRWKGLKNVGQINVTSAALEQLETSVKLRRNVTSILAPFNAASCHCFKCVRRHSFHTAQDSKILKGTKWTESARTWVIAEAERLKCEVGPCPASRADIDFLGLKESNFF